MIKKLHLKSWLLLLCMIVGAGTAWGQTWEKATSIQTGDVVILVAEDVNMELTSISTTSTKYGIGTTYTSSPAGTYSFTVVSGNSEETYAFKNGNNYLYWNSGNSLATNSELSNNTSWKVTFDDNGNAALLNVANNDRQIWWNVGSPRFACYTGKTAGDSYKNVQLYKKKSSTNVCATPIFSPAAGTYAEAQNVTISTTTEGATVYYTTDGSTPTTSSDVFSAPINVGTTTTIKAIAVKGGMDNSEVATATYTIVTPLANIAKLTEKTEAENYYVTLDNAVVTFVSGNYAYIQDASGAVVMYKSGHGLAAGDVLNGTATVAYQLRNANPQITDLSGVTPASGTAPNPTSVVQSAWNYTFSNVLSQYFQITGATITQSNNKYYVSLGGEDVQLYKVGTGISGLDLSKTYTITGFPTFYNTTKELQIFTDPVLEVTADPTMIVTPASLSNFTYEIEKGPSAAKTITVSGVNLTANISLSLGDNSNFEMCLTEDGNYTNSLTLNQADGTVTETTIYVRLKAGLDTGDYTGTLTLTSTGVTDVTVSLSGNVTAPEAPNVTWDLSKDETATASEKEMTWTSDYASMGVARGSATTPANNYYPGTSGQTYTSTRFYKNSELTITPASGYAITSVVFEATTTNYASALLGSTWTNATAKVNGTTVTITPTDCSTAISAVIGGTCGFTSVKVYYTEYEAPASAPVWSDLPTPSVNVGAEYEIDLSEYVTGNPTPSIDLNTSVASSLYEYENGLLVFQPTTAGTYAFTFTATNDEGSAEAILNVTAVEALSYTLVTAIEPGKHYIIVNSAENGPAVAMGKQNSNNRAGVLEGIQISETTATVSNDEVHEFLICGPDANGRYTIYDANESGDENSTGYLYAASSSSNYLKTQAKNNVNGIWTITFDTESSAASIVAKGSSNRNVMQFNNSNSLFSCYAEASQSPVYLYVKNGEAAATRSVTIKTGFPATTFSSDCALDFTSVPGVQAFIITDGDGSTTPVTKVPANTGIYIEGTAKTYDVPVTADITGVDVTDNLLIATDGATSYNSDDETTYYAYGKQNGKYAFFKVSATKSHTPSANKALLAIPTAQAKDFILVNGGATGINAIEAQQTENGTIYNLAGQRVAKAQKGVYIVNGKKIVIR